MIAMKLYASSPAVSPFFRFIGRTGITALIVCVSPAAFPATSTAHKELSGMEVVHAVCGTCHTTGIKGAPRIGDQKAWAKRASQGLTSLTDHALKGIREMPSHGGNPNLSDREIQRAVTYMVNQSGGKWTEPIDRKAPPVERTGEQVVKAQCFKCHQDGKGGAPKIGDRDAWIPRLKEGLDVTVRSAIKGHGGMPARGGLPDLNDREVRNAIIYMFRGGDPAK
jgi:cytochrome c5